MDSSIPVGGGYRIGIDGLIDFVPGIGDVAGVFVSAYIIYLAATSGAPESVLRRMAVKVLIDALLGAFLYSVSLRTRHLRQTYAMQQS